MEFVPRIADVADRPLAGLGIQRSSRSQGVWQDHNGPPVRAPPLIAGVTIGRHTEHRASTSIVDAPSCPRPGHTSDHGFRVSRDRRCHGSGQRRQNSAVPTPPGLPPVHPSACHVGTPGALMCATRATPRFTLTPARSSAATTDTACAWSRRRLVGAGQGVSLRARVQPGPGPPRVATPHSAAGGGRFRR